MEKEIDKEINKVESDKTKKRVRQKPHSSKSTSNLMDIDNQPLSAFSLEIPRYTVDNDRQSIFKGSQII